MSGHPNTSATTATTQTSVPLVAVYWLIVVLPLGWGVYQTVQKSLPLFRVTTSVPANVVPAATTVNPPQP